MMKHPKITAIFFILLPILLVAKEYPKASGVVLLDSTVVTLDKGMKVMTERFQRIKILTNRGRDVFGDIKTRYDKKSQNFEIITAQSLLPNGDVLLPDQDAISDVSAPEVAFATQYTNLLMKVVSFPGLENGTIIEYHYKISSKNISEIPLFGEISFQGTEPIEKKYFSISFPAEKRGDFKYNLFGTDTEPIINKQDDMISYSFSMQDMPKIESEPYMPSISRIAPKLQYTFFKDWKEFSELFTKSYFKSTKTSSKIKKMLAELGGETKEKQLENIVLYVKQKIKNVYLAFGRRGYKPTKAKKVLANKYGDILDKTALLISLLNTADINAYPVIVASKKWGYSVTSQNDENIEKSLVVPSIFKNMLVAVEINGNLQYFSPVNQFNKFGQLPSSFQDRDAIIIKKNGFEFVRLHSDNENKNRSEVFLTAELDDEGNLIGSFELNAVGASDENVRHQLKFKNKEEQDIFFETIVNSIKSGSKVVSYDFTDPENLQKEMKVTVHFESPNYATFQRKKVRFDFPQLNIYGANIRNYSKAQDRKYDLEFRAKRIYIYKAEIIIPKNFTMEYLPNFEKKNEDAYALISGNEEENIMRINSTFVIKKKTIDIAKYSDFKQLQNDFFNRNNRIVIFSK